MRFRWAVSAAPLLVLLGACDDGTGPRGVIVGTRTIDFCAGDAPIFFAYQNDGEDDWTPVEGTVDESFSFDATERVGIAMTFDRGDEILTDIYYTTFTELELVSDRACVETFGSKVLNGSVSDVLAGERAIVTMSGAEAEVEPPPTTFQLSGVANGPQDLIAHREINTVNGLTPDRVIVRRVQNFTNGATIPVLNFGTSTSDAVAANTVTISGLLAGDDNYLDIFFQTALGTDHTLFLAPFFNTSPQPIYGVPAALTQSGDFHRLDLQAEQSPENYRGVRRWYRNPANQSVALGPALTVPDIDGVGTSPYLRLRATLPSQVDYSSFATAYFIQGTTVLRSVFVTQTSGYRGGTPSNWVLEIPNLSSAGYPSSAALVPGQGTQWFVEAFNGSLVDVLGSNPAEGATLRWAGRSSDVALLRAEAPSPSGGRSPRRMRLLDQRAFGR